MKKYSCKKLPGWITLRYYAICSDTGQCLPPGSKAFYFPKSRRVFAPSSSVLRHYLNNKKTYVSEK